MKVEDGLSLEMRRVDDSTVQKQRLLERIEAVNEWVPCGEKVLVGDIVVVDAPFVSSDEGLQVSLPKGLRGEVRLVDEDGDATVNFPGLKGVEHTVRWVVAKKYKRMSKKKSTNELGTFGVGLPLSDTPPAKQFGEEGRMPTV